MSNSVETGQALAARGGGFIAALHFRDYRWLWYSSMLSGNGQWTLVVARGWLMDRLTHSAGAVGLVTFASMLPYLLATPVGGILADRFDRRRLTAAMQGVSLLAAAVLAALVLWGDVQPWQVVCLALVAGFGRAMETPATQSMIPGLIPSSRLLNAISLNSMANFGSRLLGPAAAFGFLHSGNVGAVFVMTGVCYVLAILCILRVNAPRLEARIEQSVWRETVESWKFIGNTPMLPTIFVLMSLHCGLTMITDAVMPDFARTVLHGQGSTYDLLIIGFGAGTMAGTFALGGLRSDAATGSVLLLAGLFSGLTLAALALTRSLLPAFLVMALLGAAQGMYVALGNTLVMVVAPDRLRGRVSSAYLMAVGGTMSFGILGAGILTDRFSLQAVLIIPALLFVGVVVVLSLLRPELRRMYRTGSLPQRQAAPPPAAATALVAGD